ncbi:MAG TPA: isoaspartyl peptidase/L-asparaginase [Longimicrobiales bacterium]|nr:isoaspartyl peptidase/L-asparaginase [Longimicrobiales bacterium]
MTTSSLRTAAAALVLGTLGCASSPNPPTRVGAPAALDEIPRIDWGLVIHGGAGTITRESMTPGMERQYRETMEAAMRAGHAVLRDGGGSLDAVTATINVMEDSPLFNAGKGAVFTAEGTNSLDASIMYGPTLAAGAVAGVTRVRNPIDLARMIMEQSPHVMLSGAGAEEFARLRGIELVDPSYFHTEHRWRALQEARRGESGGADDAFGTVGVVALDRSGALAAGTSTGGMTNKKWGRIGDSPVIGAGTYAGPNCGVSATGWGEYFIRNVVAYDICARMRYQGISLEESAHAMIMEQLEAQEPETGGIVALDGEGHVVMTFNSAGMYRGYVGADGRVHTAIYR